MPKPVIRDGQDSFVGGVNQVGDPARLAPNEMQTCSNFRLGSQGDRLIIRGGVTKTSAGALTAANVKGGFLSSFEAKLMAVAGGDLFTSDGFNIPMTWTNRGGSLSTTVISKFVQFMDSGGDNVIFIADGGQLNRWNDSTSTLSEDLAGTATVHDIVVYNKRLFGFVEGGDTLYWSELNEGDTLGVVASGGGSAVINTLNKQGIMALIPLGATLFIMHEGSISAFTGWSQDDIAIATGAAGVASDVGCATRHSVVIANDVAYFVFDGFVWSLTRDGQVKNISADKLSKLSTSDIAAIKGTVHLPQYHEVIWFGQTTPLVYNYKLGCFYHNSYTLASSATIQCAFSGRTATGIPHAYLGGSDGFVRELEVGTTDEDSVINVSAKLQRKTFGSILSHKALRFAHAYHSHTATWTLTLASDVTTEALTIPLSIATGQPVRVHASLRGTWYDPTISGTSTNLNGGGWIQGIALTGFNMGERF
jgi:hypothetical protein